jgi:ribonuclease HI
LKQVEVWSDGSATTAENPGGWAFVVVVDGVKVYEASGGLQSCTNNVAELTAALEGLKHATANYPQDDITLISDSMLVLNYTNGKWQCKKLHLAMLHANLRKLYTTFKVSTRWIRGHTGVEHNERCDQLAKAERAKLMQDEA